jgi:non-heme chloroperoxidase
MRAKSQDTLAQWRTRLMLHNQNFSGHAGVRLAADTGGDPAAPSVILLHGSGQTRYSWGQAARELVQAGFYVVSLDLRGHGESQWAPDGDYSLDAFVGDLKAVCAALPNTPALVGASLGGTVSMLALGEDPAIARAVVLVDIVLKIEKDGVERIRNFMQGNPDGFATLADAADAVAAYLPHRPRPANHDGLKKNLREGPDGRLYWHWDPAFQLNRRQRGFGDTAARMELAARQIAVPTLLVRGKASEIVSAEGARHLQSLIPHAETVDVDGAGHMVAGDRNDVFNTAVIDFLKRTQPAARLQA